MSAARALAVAFLGCLGLWAEGCAGGDSKGTGQPPTTPGETPFCELSPACQKIAAVCMPKDDGTGAVHDCHMTGMYYAVESDCQKQLTTCLSTCQQAPSLSDGAVEDLMAQCRDSGAGGKTDAGSNALTFPTQALSTFTTDGKDLTIELRTAPEQPIHVGPGYEGQLEITDAASGAPVDGLDIRVTTLMPVMGHACSPVAVKVEPQGQGVYVLNPLLGSMKGACELEATISGARSGHAVSPTFDVAP